ncbi:MAG: ribosome silencing factor [Terracidiphilus sp.]
MTTSQAHEQTRILVQAAAKVCEDKKGEDTRILELDPIDSGLSDFFLITSALNDRQAQAIADEIEFTLKRDHGVYATSVEGRRQGDWILLDYVDFVVHVFLAERRAFYDIERLRKSARPLTPAEFDAELKSALAAKTRATRSKAGVPKSGTPIAGSMSMSKDEGSSTQRRKVAPAKALAKPALKHDTTRKLKGPISNSGKVPSANEDGAKRVAAKKASGVKRRGD